MRLFLSLLTIVGLSLPACTAPYLKQLERCTAPQSKPTLYVVSSPGCGWCLRSLPKLALIDTSLVDVRLVKIPSESRDFKAEAVDARIEVYDGARCRPKIDNALLPTFVMQDAAGNIEWKEKGLSDAALTKLEAMAEEQYTSRMSKAS